MLQRKQYMAAQAQIFKALGHPSRLLMVDALRNGEQCVCDLRQLVGDDISTVSKHLAVLRQAGIVEQDKRGTNIYYRLSLPCLDNFLSCTRALLENRLALELSILREE